MKNVCKMSSKDDVFNQFKNKASNSDNSKRIKKNKVKPEGLTKEIAQDLSIFIMTVMSLKSLHHLPSI